MLLSGHLTVAENSYFLPDCIGELFYSRKSGIT